MNPLPIAKLTYLEIYAVLTCVLCVILLQTLHDGRSATVRHRLFIGMTVSAMITILTEAVAWLLDGVPGQTARSVLYAVDAIDTILTPVPAFLWLCYIAFHVTRDLWKLQRLAAVLIALFGYIGVLIVLTPAHGLLFTLDQTNRYHRGPWFWQLVLISFAVLLCSEIFILLARHRLPRRELLPLLFFPVPPVVGVLLQMRFYGLSSAQSGTVIALLLLYISLQSQLRGTDYLTGLSNRRQLDACVERIIANPHPRHPTALLMMDMDHLKSINDTWGHTVGDRAIEHCAAILRKCFHHNDIIARFAGDEFVAVLELEQADDINPIVERLMEMVERLGKPEDAPFTIRLSVGYAIYPDDGARSIVTLYHQADQRMYAVKRAKEGREGC